MNQRGGTLVQNTKKRLTHLLDPHREEVEAGRRKIDEAYTKYKDASIQKGMGDATGYEEVVEQLRHAHGDHQAAVQRQVEHDARLRAYGLVGLSGITVPTLAGVAGYQGAKAGGQNGNI